ncbi:MAG TPA: EI24 domain-containing protein [Magnetospirillum sp.]|nr:EI24 domain-containing protein [Magnetospirillum sp.]
MPTALFKAFAQLFDPALRRVVGIGVLGALGTYLALVALVWVTLPHITFFEDGWADTGTGIALGFAALVLPILFFPAMVTLIMGVMLDGVADAVEARHYPQLNWPRPQKWTEIVGGTLRFMAVTVVINVLALPIYIVLMITGFSLVLAIGINGYLLGREYFELVAARRLDPAQVKRCFNDNHGRLWLAGAVIAVLFSMPFVNLVAPVVATAFMVHLFQSLRRQKDLI